LTLASVAFLLSTGIITYSYHGGLNVWYNYAILHPTNAAVRRSTIQTVFGGELVLSTTLDQASTAADSTMLLESNADELGWIWADGLGVDFKVSDLWGLSWEADQRLVRGSDIFPTYQQTEHQVRGHSGRSQACH
jgi:hypothetical protein